MPWHLWYRTLLLMAWIVVYVLMEQTWTELSADTDLDTTDTSFCTSPHSVQKGGSVRNGHSYHSVRSQWWRTQSSARAWRKTNKLPSQRGRNSLLKHKCLRWTLEDEVESSSNGSGVGHRHAEHTYPTITNHTFRCGPTLSPDRPTSKSSLTYSSEITVLMSVLTSVLFCSVLLLGDNLAPVVGWSSISLKAVMIFPSQLAFPPLAFPHQWQHQCPSVVVATATFSVFWPPIHSSPSPIS